jgi:MFS family permease
MEKEMRRVGQKMSLYMGVTLSFILSLVGTLSSGHFTVPGWLISFVCSTIIALIIGFVVPMGKISRDLTEKLNLDPESVPAKLLKALVSDLIYTPLITLAMVYMAYRQASAHGAPVNFWGMFLPSLLLSLVVAYFCIYFIEPIFLKKVMRDMNRK